MVETLIVVLQTLSNATAFIARSPYAAAMTAYCANTEEHIGLYIICFLVGHMFSFAAQC